MQELLPSKEGAEPTREREGQRWDRKEASTGHSHTLYGEVTGKRHVDRSNQSHAGGGY